jgi:Ulp1 family protease
MWFELLNQRNLKATNNPDDEKEKKTIHFFNTFFLLKLTQGGGYNYKNVRRWAKGFDIFALDKVIMPHNSKRSCVGVCR